MSKVHETFVAEMATLLERFATVEEDIGVSVEIRQRHQTDLLDKIRTLLREAVKLAEERKDALQADVVRMIQEIEAVQTALGDRRSTEADGSLSLEQRHKWFSSVLAALNERKAARSTSLKVLYETIAAAAKELGCAAIEASYADITQAHVSHVEQELARLQAEKAERAAQARELCTAIVELWGQLSITCQSELDRRILARELDSAVGAEVLQQLASKQIVLEDEKARRLRSKAELTAEIDALNVRLRIPEADRVAFQESVAGLSSVAIDRCREQLELLRERKRHSIAQFIVEARQLITAIWDKLYYPQDKRNQFAAAFDDSFTEESLALHEAELATLQAKVPAMEEVSRLLDAHIAVKTEHRAFIKSTMDPKRLMKRSGVNPLEEARQRKVFNKRIPEIEEPLRRALEAFEATEGFPLTVRGFRYLDIIADPMASLAPEEPAAASSVGSSTEVLAPRAATARTSRMTTAGHSSQANARSATIAGTAVAASRTPAKRTASMMLSSSNGDENEHEISESPIRRSATLPLPMTTMTVMSPVVEGEMVRKRSRQDE